MAEEDKGKLVLDTPELILKDAVARFDRPLPINMPTVIDLFKGFKSSNFNSDKPGTDVSMGDLLTVTDFYLDKEYDNPESCQVHRKIQQLAGIIKELEDSISD